MIDALKPLAALAALAALTQPQIASAQAACMTEAELGALSAFALPSALDGVMTACRPHLAATGYFATSGRSLISRYAARKDAAWPMAKTAIFKLGAAKAGKIDPALANLPDSALQPLADGLVTQMVGTKIEAKQCAPIERVAQLLAPLPAENTSALVGFLLAISAKDKVGKASGLTLCQAPAAARAK